MQVDVHMFHGYDNPWVVQYQADSMPEGGQIKEYLESTGRFQSFGLYVKHGNYFDEDCVRVYELYERSVP